MPVEHATIEIGYLAIHLLKLTFVAWCIQAILEELHEEPLVERLKKLVFAPLLLAPRELVAQVVDIAVKKTLLLYEVTEHQSVEHHRGVPLLVAVRLQVSNLVIDTRNKLDKSIVFFLEACIEVLSNLLAIDSKSALYALLHIHDGRALVEVEA